ncbi:hemolysin III family protein [[Pseudomonas] carboxydohydrogena]|uniref:PAQR family membrane homeostasis protein TrhA n=1 Tax=Afipia carboxydohydrogena TaxID=290 RepID=UPI0023B0A709|nr:hemolysin III family protein [[Pseudomonas] carboxydohydrogena]
MTIFRLKDLTAFPPLPGRGAKHWCYDRAELIADSIVHVTGLSLGLIAATVLIVLAGIYASTLNLVTTAIYAVGLIAMLAFSAVYNLWPVSPVKWVLRRFDHSAIYVLIAATYTPFLAQMADRRLGFLLIGGVWSVALIGIALKVFYPGRFDKLAVVLYLALGWSGVMAYDSIAASLSSTTLWLIAIGGVLYSAGVIFHAWERLRFQNAIWHGFVLLAAACHYSAVLDTVLIAN